MKVSKKVLSIVAVGAIALSSGQVYAEENKLSITQPILKRDIPSASGVEYYKDAYYIIGDDSSYLFKLDQAFDVKDRQVIKAYEIGEDGRIPKKIKPDYEMMDVFTKGNYARAIVLGSGSKADIREWGYIVGLDGKSKIERHMGEFYKALHKAAGMNGETVLNLEGIALAENKFVLLNRGNSGENIIFTVDKEEVFEYMSGDNIKFKSINAYPVTLPEISGNVAGLSGVDYVEATKSIVLTASVECTNDPINDGEILGSFVGLVEMDEFEKNMDLTKAFKLIELGDKPYITKAESVTVKSVKEDVIKGVIVSDNDDGTSEVFHFTLMED